jgi:hypothetical protein
MKLKEWGLMRHRGRKSRPDRLQISTLVRQRNDEEPRTSSATAEPMSIESESLEHRTKTGEWQAVAGSMLETAESNLMGLLNQNTKYGSPDICISQTDVDQLTPIDRDTGMDAKSACRFGSSARHAWLYLEQRV